MENIGVDFSFSGRRKFWTKSFSLGTTPDSESVPSPMGAGVMKKVHHCRGFACSLFIMGLFHMAPAFRSNQIDPLDLGQADPQCWEFSSTLLLEMRNPHVADSVDGFWNFMLFLKSSENLKHGALFWDLAQLFWDIYVDCVLSRTHGLGKRQLAVGQQYRAVIPSWIRRRSVSEIQTTPIWKKKALMKTSQAPFFTRASLLYAEELPDT